MDHIKSDVVIIGGGISGLACAVGLLGTGLDVVVVESSGVLGGRARSWIDSSTGDAIDIGPHVITSAHRNMLRLLELLETNRQVVWHTDNFLIIADRPPVVMKRYPLPAPLSLLPSLFTAKTPSLRDLASNTRVVLFSMKLNERDIMHLDRVAATNFLRSMGVTPRFIDWFWRSTAMTLLNVPLEQCSTGALLRVYRQLLMDNGLRFGFPAGGLGDLFVPTASARIKSAGGRIILSQHVRQLIHETDRVRGIILDDGTRITARYCVSAIPPQDLEHLIPEEWRVRYEVFQNLSVFKPVPYVSSYLWFDRKLTQEQMWTRIWSIKNLNYDFYDLTNIRPGWCHRPSVIASNIINNRSAEELSDEAIIQSTVHELAEFIPAAEKATVLHTSIHRIPMAIPAPHPGNESKRPNTVSPIQGLLLAGDWTNTHFPASMESAVRSGFSSADRVLTEIEKPKDLALPPSL